MGCPLTCVGAALHPGMTIEDLEAMHLQKLDEAANRPLINNDNAVSITARLAGHPLGNTLISLFSGL